MSTYSDSREVSLELCGEVLSDLAIGEGALVKVGINGRLTRYTSLFDNRSKVGCEARALLRS